MPQKKNNVYVFAKCVASRVNSALSLVNFPAFLIFGSSPYCLFIFLIYIFFLLVVEVVVRSSNELIIKD